MPRSLHTHQDCTATKFGFGVSATRWLELAGSFRRKPRLQFDVTRMNSQDLSTLSLRQSDKLGVISLNTKADVRSMPESVNSFTFGASIKSLGSSCEGWMFSMTGFAADNECHRAAMLGYQLKF